MVTPHLHPDPAVLVSALTFDISWNNIVRFEHLWLPHRCSSIATYIGHFIILSDVLLTGVPAAISIFVYIYSQWQWTLHWHSVDQTELETFLLPSRRSTIPSDISHLTKSQSCIFGIWFCNTLLFYNLIFDNLTYTIHNININLSGDLVVFFK